jgi:hypothetical protein
METQGCFNNYKTKGVIFLFITVFSTVHETSLSKKFYCITKHIKVLFSFLCMFFLQIFVWVQFMQLSGQLKILNTANCHGNSEDLKCMEKEHQLSKEEQASLEKSYGVKLPIHAAIFSRAGNAISDFCCSKILRRLSYEKCLK